MIAIVLQPADIRNCGCVVKKEDHDSRDLFSADESSIIIHPFTVKFLYFHVACSVVVPGTSSRTVPGTR